jgi:TonB family protein
MSRHFNIRQTHFLGVLFLCLFARALLAQDHKKLEQELRHSFVHKILSLRNPHFGRVLEFDSSGNLRNKAEAGPWSTCGLLRVDDIDFRPDRLEIKGKRIVLGQRYAAKEEHPSKISGPQITTVITNEQVRIVVTMSASNVSEVNDILSHVFQGGPLETRVAAYWKSNTDDVDEFRRNTPNAIVGELEGKRPVYLANPGVITPSKPIHTPEPTYTEIARQNKIQGRAVLSVVVNEEGLPEVLEIKEGLSDGLDIQAMAAVAGWRFQPAMKDGQPVAVLITVQVEFHLY